MSVEILHPKSRDEWLGLRGKTIGASEAACLFGEHPFQSEFELWAHKSGKVPTDPSETGPMRRGRHLESVAVEFLREERPLWKVTANPIPGGMFYRDLSAGLSCTPDAFVIDPERSGTGICQIKSVEPSVFRKKWQRDDKSIDLPTYVAVQAIQEAKLTGATWAVVCPLVIGFSIEMPVIEVPLHEGIWDRLCAEAGEFWRRVAAGEPPPPDYARDGDVMRRMWPPDPNAEVADLTGDNRLGGLADEREAIQARAKADANRKKEIDAEFLHKLAGAAYGRIAGDRRIEHKTVSRKAYSIAANSYTQLNFK